MKQQRYRSEIRGLQQDRKTPQASLGGWIEQADGKPFPIEAQYTHYLVDRAIRKLDAALAESPARSTCNWTSSIRTSRSASRPGLEERERHLRGVVGLPESYEKRARPRLRAPWPDEPKIYDFYRRSWGLYDPETVRDYRVANALQMEVIDRALAKFIGELKAPQAL